ncbi:MAG TPA: PEP-CTERM/exosortase system-associated acyltransferase [Gammaproteobacteria bacterium]|nr:PEP-CTERM/exosortase system-associated acyltransferase [Gammaproteobacteria bacterium]
MFDDKFRVCFADTPHGLELHQRIRYQVFCLEKGFEDPAAFSRERETDAWDDQAAHFVVQDKRSGQWVAATRVVLPHPSRKLPVETLQSIEPPIELPPDARVGEISRFCIINAKEIEVAPVSVAVQDELARWDIGSVASRERFEVILGMLRAVAIFSLKRDIDYCYMLITPPFVRLLRKLGVVLHQAGAPVEYRGKRSPYMADMRESIQNMIGRSREVKKLFARARLSYVRISKVVQDPEVELVSEFSPEHSLFNETLFRETVLQPEE